MEGKEPGLATVAESLLGLLIRACIVIELWSPRHCTELGGGGGGGVVVLALELVWLQPTRSGNKLVLQGTVHP